MIKIVLGLILIFLATVQGSMSLLAISNPSIIQYLLPNMQMLLGGIVLTFFILILTSYLNKSDEVDEENISSTNVPLGIIKLFAASIIMMVISGIGLIVCPLLYGDSSITFIFLIIGTIGSIILAYTLSKDYSPS